MQPLRTSDRILNYWMCVVDHAVGNAEKVVYLICKLGEQRLLQIPTSPLSNDHNRLPVIIAARLVIGRLPQTDHSLAHAFFAGASLASVEA